MLHSFALMLAVSTLVRSPLPADFRPTQLHVESSWNGLAAQLPPAVDIDCAYAHLTWSCKGGWIEDSWVRVLLAAVRIPGDRNRTRTMRLAGYNGATMLERPSWTYFFRRKRTRTPSGKATTILM